MTPPGDGTQDCEHAERAGRLEPDQPLQRVIDVSKRQPVHQHRISDASFEHSIPVVVADGSDSLDIGIDVAQLDVEIWGNEVRAREVRSEPGGEAAVGADDAFVELNVIAIAKGFIVDRALWVGLDTGLCSTLMVNASR